MELERVSKTDPQREKGARTRALAGKALAVFIALMAALTWANKMLEEMTIATVSTTTVQRGALEKVISASGALSASAVVPVLAEDAARVLDVYVEAGAYVEAGDPLFRLDYGDVVKDRADALDSARTELEKKQRSLDWAAADLTSTALSRLTERQQAVADYKQAYEKARDDYDAASASGKDAQALEILKRAADQALYLYETEKRRLDGDTAVRDYLGKYDDLTAAQQALAEAEEAYGDTLAMLDEGAETVTVASPVSGSVLSSSLSVGSSVSTSAPVMTVSDQTGGLELTVRVDEEAAGEMTPGEAATVSVNGESYQCPIVSVAISADNQDMYDVTFLLPGDAGTAGMSASMRFRKRTQSYDIIIPLSALRSDSDGDFVLIVEQMEDSLGAKTSVRRVDVYVLDQDSDRAALQSGVSQRDQLVTRSDRDIQDGDRVRLSEE